MARETDKEAETGITMYQPELRWTGMDREEERIRRRVDAD